MASSPQKFYSLLPFAFLLSKICECFLPSKKRIQREIPVFQEMSVYFDGTVAHLSEDIRLECGSLSDFIRGSWVGIQQGGSGLGLCSCSVRGTISSFASCSSKTCVFVVFIQIKEALPKILESLKVSEHLTFSVIGKVH